MNCIDLKQHNFQYLRTTQHTKNDGGYSTYYLMIDYFYCTKCLEYKEVKKETWCRDTPEWYK
jgi:hypothetical protein